MPRPMIAMALLFAAGCTDYNVHETRSEGDVLSAVTRLTGPFAKAGQARLSADGRWVAFRATPSTETHHQLYVARVDWSGAGPRIDRPVRVTPPGSINGPGSFSPDGFTLLFCSTGPPPDGKPVDGKKLHMVQVAGWEQNVSLADASRGVDLTASMPIDVPGNDFCFTPDGRFVLFDSDRDGTSKIYATPVGGGPAVPLTAGPDVTPAVSPDGKSFAFRRDRADGGDLFVADFKFDPARAIVGSNDPAQVTHDDNVNASPAWHPDNRHIVYATSLHGRTNYDLYVMGRDGRDKTRVTFWEGADLFPVFTPDGRWLCWTSTRGDDHAPAVYLAKFAFPQGS